MSDIKISALPAAGALGGTEQAPVVQAGVTTKATVSQIPAYLNSLAAIKFGQNFLQITPTAMTASFWGIFADGSASFGGGGLLTIAGDGTLTINGNVILHPDGGIEIVAVGKGVTMRSPNGTAFVLTVTDNGQLNVT